MKSVVLCSGGFDSIVLLKYLYYVQENHELYPIHFLYGAKNEKEQLECTKKICEELRLPLKVVQLPIIDWSQNDFYHEEHETNVKMRYLEYRNLIFLSYASSYAEAIEAKEIQVAFINNNSSTFVYPDITPEFVEGLNSFLLPFSDISVEAPFIYKGKQELAHIAKYLHINKDEYFSCDFPVDGKPCEVCSDCLALKNTLKKVENLAKTLVL